MIAFSRDSIAGSVAKPKLTSAVRCLIRGLRARNQKHATSPRLTRRRKRGRRLTAQGRQETAGQTMARERSNRGWQRGRPDSIREDTPPHVQCRSPLAGRLRAGQHRIVRRFLAVERSLDFGGQRPRDPRQRCCPKRHAQYDQEAAYQAGGRFPATPSDAAIGPGVQRIAQQGIHGDRPETAGQGIHPLVDRPAGWVKSAPAAGGISAGQPEFNCWRFDRPKARGQKSNGWPPG